MARHAVDMPEVTDTHRRAAFVALRWMGRYEDAISAPFRAQLIEAKAAWLRTTEWERTTQRTVVPVHRIRLGADGHPIGWSTEITHGPSTQAHQPDLLTQPTNATA